MDHKDRRSLRSSNGPHDDAHKSKTRSRRTDLTVSSALDELMDALGLGSSDYDVQLGPDPDQQHSRSTILWQRALDQSFRKISR